MLREEFLLGEMQVKHYKSVAREWKFKEFLISVCYIKY